MPVFGGLTPQQFINYAQLALVRHRDALLDVKKVSDGIAGYSQQDLINAGLTAAEASAITAAIADGMGEYNIHYSGSDPRNPGAGYIYASSQEAVIGPIL